MIKRILIIGGYGNFGSFISRELAKEKNIQVIIAGRSLEKAKQLTNDVAAVNKIEAVSLDINNDVDKSLTNIRPDIVIHTSGPFQVQGYSVAEACIQHNAHYIDLADGRRFVNDITQLDGEAKKHKVLVCSGASSVPCLTSAVIDNYIKEFQQLESVDYGITTAQKTARGLATTAAILGYTGKPFTTLINGSEQNIYGWQSLHRRHYKKLGSRLLGNCDIPDLDLFPQRYPSLKTIRFYAGLEIPFIHITLWSLSWLVRLGLIKRLQGYAPLLLRTSFLFDWLGSSNSAFHMIMSGRGNKGHNKVITFELTARSGDGPYIPCMPAIIMAKKLTNHEIERNGAQACVDFITFTEYLDALKPMDISWDVKQHSSN